MLPGGGPRGRLVGLIERRLLGGGSGNLLGDRERDLKRPPGGGRRENGGGDLRVDYKHN